MTKKQKSISNAKIIAFVAFVCCALITSLFVYHLSHKQSLTIIADGNATLFPVARDIKPFELASTNHPSFTQKDFIGHDTLVFFGFTHCASVCPTTLNMLAHAYNQLHTISPTLQIVFISLDPERDSIDKLTSYVHSFHPTFIGLAGKIQDIRKLQSQHGIYSATDDAASTGGDYQIQHTPSILYINPKGQWAGVFKSSVTKVEFIEAFRASINNHA